MCYHGQRRIPGSVTLPTDRENAVREDRQYRSGRQAMPFGKTGNTVRKDRQYRRKDRKCPLSGIVENDREERGRDSRIINMHELGLADALVKMVDKLAKEESAEKVISVTISIGDLSGVVPHFMADAWEAVTDGTAYEGVPLNIETIPGIAQCAECGEQFRVDTKRMRCPSCGGVKLVPVSGRDMTIEEIDVI